jgi:hypothetical protein
MPCPCRAPSCAHAVPLSYRAVKGLECVFPIWFTQCGRVWFTLDMPCPCHALTMPFFSRPRHSAAVERRTVGYLPAFGFFRLPRGVPRRFLSEAHQSSSQRSIPTTVNSGSSTLQKRRSIKLWDYQFGYFRLPRGLSRRTRHCRSRARARHGKGTVWARHDICESALRGRVMFQASDCFCACVSASTSNECCWSTDLVLLRRLRWRRSSQETGEIWLGYVRFNSVIESGKRRWEDNI